MSQRQNLIFLFVMLLMHLGAFIWAVREQPQLRDSSEYLQAAHSFEKNGDFYCFDAREQTDMRGFTKRPPLYPIIIFLCRHQQSVVLFLQLLLSLVSIYLFQSWVLTLSKTTPFSSGAFILYLFTWIFSFSQFIYSGLIMADIWMQGFTLLLVYLAYQAFATPKPGYWVAMAGVVIAGFLLKPVMSLLVWAFPLALILRFYTLPRKLFVLLPVALLPIFVLLLINRSNENNTGYRHYSSISNINLLHYNTRYTLMSAYGSAEKADSILAPLMIKTADKAVFRANNEAITKQCRKYLLEHWTTYLTLHVKGMARMMIDPGRFDVYSFFNLDKDDTSGLMERSVSNKNYWLDYVKRQPLGWMALLVLILLFNLLKLYAFIRLVFWKGVPLLFRLIVLLAVLYFTGLTGPLGASRFLLPVLPVLAVSVLFVTPKIRDAAFQRAPK